MKPEALQRWQRIRAHGKTRFILVTGASYAVPMFIATTYFAHRQEVSSNFIAISAIAWLIGGALGAITMWYLQERQYRKAIGSA